jgi:hypothetical protein
MIVYIIRMGVTVVIDTVNILMSTNIPNQPNVSFTSKMIVNTSPNAAKYNEYPYITKSCRFNGNLLKGKSLNEIFDFFFIKEIFAKYVNDIGKYTTIDYENKEIFIPSETDPKKINKEKKKWEEKQAAKKNEFTEKIQLENIKYNIEKMIKLIFHTHPIIGNIRSTIDKRYITDPFNVNKYSYLSINSGVYTVAKITWINDVHNHYLPIQLLKDYKEFTAWLEGENRNISSKKSDNKVQSDAIITGAQSDAFKETLNSDITTIEKYILNTLNWVNGTSTILAVRNAMDGLYAHLIILQYTIDKEASKANEERLETSMPYGTKDQTSVMAKRKADILSEIGKRKYYNYKDSEEFISELNRVLKIVIGSNYIRISNVLQNLIKDLNDKNDIRISLNNDMNYIKDPQLILGNDKYKNENFKTLSNAFVKNVQLIKKTVNFSDYKKFDFETMQKFINQLSDTNNIKPQEFGIIYDNNNVTKPKYELYMYVDLISGKITDENKDKIDLCSFRDELLLIKFNQLINGNTHIIQHDPLIKILKEKTATAAVKTATAAVKTAKAKPAMPSQGGNTTRRLYYVLNNTHKKNNITIARFL